MSGPLAPRAMTSNRPWPAADAEAVVLETRVVRGSGGGPDKTILNTPRFLASTRYRTLCAYMHPPGDPGFEQIKAKALAWGAPLLSIPDRGPLDWRVVAELAKVCRRERVAIWHGHDYKSNALGLLLRRIHRMKLVTTVHGWGVQATRRTPFYNRIDRLCLPHYDQVICVSEDLRSACLSCGVAESRCVLVSNAIDMEQFRRRRTAAEAKAAFGLPAGRLLVGAVGRLSGEKGFDVLIRAADRLVQKGRDVGLAIAGEGSELGRLKALIDGLGRSDRFRLLGYVADPAPLYEAMDAYALSSLSEGLPNVLLEAMAFEVPVVATRVAGVPRLVEDDGNGLLVGPGSEEELAAALSRLLDDDAMRLRLGRAARRTIEADYSFDARIRRIRSIYDELLGAAPEGPGGNHGDLDPRSEGLGGDYGDLDP
jgi:glycosyltransferase involved in cell wall biosynthesis